MANEKKNLNVLWVAESNFVEGSGIKKHSHNYYHLFLVRQGSAKFTVGTDQVDVQAGELIIAKPGIEHGLKNNTKALCRCYEVKFTTSTLGLSRLLEMIPSHLPSDDFVIRLVKEIIEESALAEAATPSIVSEYLISLINYCYRKYGQKSESVTSIIDTTSFSDVSREVVHFLENNYQRELPLQEIADSVDFNKNYLCSLFKSDTGMTVGNTLTIIRIRKAAELISFSDMNLTQVAEATGFTNVSHFNRVFKKVVGIPPGQYRSMFKVEQLILGDVDTVDEALESNGFIISVLGRKRLNISDILLLIEETQED